MTTKFQVGHLVHIENDDPTFDDFSEAVDFTIKRSLWDDKYEYMPQPYGVWEITKMGITIRCIVYNGQVYSRLPSDAPQSPERGDVSHRSNLA